MEIRSLRNKQAFFFDLDGCIYYGDTIAPGAKEFLEILGGEGKRIGYITNNSRENAVEIAAKIKRMGLIVRPEEMITATEFVGGYIKRKYGRLQIKAAGTDSLAKSLAGFGHTVIPFDTNSAVDLIVIARDTLMNYDKLQQIVHEMEQGTKVISTNPDITHPGKNNRKVLETGSLVAAIEAVFECKIEFVGKPAPHMFQYGMSKYGMTPAQSVMVGDNLLTDIAGGLEAGMSTVWISGGNHLDQAGYCENTMKSSTPHNPHITVSHMEELFALYTEGGS